MPKPGERWPNVEKTRKFDAFFQEKRKNQLFEDYEPNIKPMLTKIGMNHPITYSNTEQKSSIDFHWPFFHNSTRIGCVNAKIAFTNPSFCVKIALPGHAVNVKLSFICFKNCLTSHWSIWAIIHLFRIKGKVRRAKNISSTPKFSKILIRGQFISKSRISWYLGF